MKIVNYGIVEPHQVCQYCHRPNHRDNTHCWYCDKRLQLSVIKRKGEKDGN